MGKHLNPAAANLVVAGDGSVTVAVGTTFFATLIDFNDRASSDPANAATYLGFRVVQDLDP